MQQQAAQHLVTGLKGVYSIATNRAHQEIKNGLSITAIPAETPPSSVRASLVRSKNPASRFTMTPLLLLSRVRKALDGTSDSDAHLKNVEYTPNSLMHRVAVRVDLLKTRVSNSAGQMRSMRMYADNSFFESRLRAFLKSSP